MVSNTAAGETTQSTGLTAFGTTGFTIGALAKLNTSSATYVSWTFRKQPKFFDVVTYTGNGSNRTISHNLGSVPGCIMVKRTDTTGAWAVYHRSLANTEYMVLNTTAAKATGATYWNSTTPTSTQFSLGTATDVNANTGTYVAYLFAHNAGGFGAAGSDNVISCGSYTGNGSLDGPSINLGYEVQFVIIKNTTNSTSTNWYMQDVMRGMSYAQSNLLFADSSAAEGTSGAPYVVVPTATGFKVNTDSARVNTNGDNYIYIAIRRGPMRVPTSGTSVFAPSARSGTGASGTSTALGSVTDLTIIKQRGSTETWAWTDRLRGASRELTSAGTTAETAYANDVTGFDNMTGFAFGSGASGQVNTSASTYIDYLLRRAPGFMDVVCYTGNGSTQAITHNLGSVPELMIIKQRSNINPWPVYTGPSVNLLTYSEGFDNAAWVKANATVTADATTAPNGTTTADKLVESAVTAIHRVSQQVTTSATVTNTGTVYVKAAERTQVNVALIESTATHFYQAIYDLNTLSISAGGSGTFTNTATSITSVGNGWFRCSITAAFGSGTAVILAIDTAAAGSAVTTGNGTNGIFIWGAQLEVGSSATAYVPTVTFGGTTQILRLNTTAAFTGVGSDWWGNNVGGVSPTRSTFTVGSNGEINTSTATYVAYLFATVPGVSKVGSYSGTGAAQTINCGFTGGARFILIKRTDSTGDWYVYDTARGIISGNDPYLLINSTAAEVTGTDYISVQSSGFGLTASAPAALNANGGSFVFLAIS